MRQHLANHALALLALASGTTGCSLLYNPSNLPPQVDAPPDAEVLIDADPGMLTLTTASPSLLVEGTGANGSRTAVLVLEGGNMVKDGAMVSLSPAAGSTKTPMVMVDNTQLVVEGNGMRLAVPITLPVDSGLGAADTIAMDITVTQLANGTPVSKKLAGKLHIYCGDMDNYYLNNAVYRMEEFLESTTDPYYAGEVDYGDRAEHCWNGDHTRPNAVSRLRYHLMYVDKMLGRMQATAPVGADLTSWRY